MGLKSAVAFFKGIPDRTRDIYSFDEGWMYTSALSLDAAYPVPHMLGKFGLTASDLDAAVTRFAGEPRVEAGDGTLVLKSGRLKSSIDLVDVDEPSQALHKTVPNPDAIPENLLEAIEMVLPFAASDGTWQKSVELSKGKVRAIDSYHGASAEVPGLDLGDPLPLPADTLKFIVSREAPIGIKRLPSALAIFWASGAWVLLRLSTQAWPSLADSIFAKAKDAETPVAFTDEWREAFVDVAALGDGYIDLAPDGLTAKTAHAEARAELPTGAAGSSRWRRANLADVMKVATHWDPDAPAPAPFRGDGIVGIVAGVRTK